MPRKARQIPVADFAFEILDDLPTLVKEYPEGISTAVLSDYYGESYSRVLLATNQLVTKGELTRQQVGKMFFFVPKGHPPPPALVFTLSKLQLDLYLHVQDKCKSSSKGKFATNYSRLATYMGCSLGGARAIIKRLCSLNLVCIEREYDRKEHTLVISLPNEPQNDS